MRVILLLALLGLASAVDAKEHRIPNGIPASLLLAGIGLGAAAAGWTGALHAAGGAAVGLLLLLPFHMMRGMGAGDVKLMARAVEGIEMKDLKSLADDGKKQLGSGVVAIVGVTGDGKAGVVVGVTADLTSRYNAIDLVRVASEALGGKGGGGRPDMAQAGGPDGAKADAALSAIEKAMAGA